MPMESVRRLTGLAYFDVIKVRVRAKNDNCSGPWSPANTVGALIPACPAVMVVDGTNLLTIAADATTDASITVNWTAPANKATTAAGGDCDDDTASREECYGP